MTLLAPAGGAALVGPGPGEVQRLLAWESAEVRALLTGDGESAARKWRQELVGVETAVAYSRSSELRAGLAKLAPRVVTRDPEPPPQVHAARWLASALEALDGALDVEAVPALLAATPGEEREAATWRRQLPAGFVALHPGSGSPAKTWPVDRFRALQQRLAPGHATLVVLGPAEAGLAAAFASDCVVAQALPLRVLGAVLAHAGLFVGNDSGVSHLAAAWGAPTLALFGPTDPRTLAPEGAHVRTLRGAGGCLDQLSIEDVQRAAEELREQKSLANGAAH